MGCLSCSKAPKSPAQLIVKVAIGSTIMSILTVISTGGYLFYISQKKIHFNTQPNLAADFLAALVVFNLSVYQLIVSGILLRQATSVKAHGYKMYYVSLWYVSHLSLLTIYGGLIIMEIFLSIFFREYLKLAIVLAVATVYMGIFSTFVAVVVKQLPSADN